MELRGEDRTRIGDQDNATERPTIDKFWETLKIRL